jgi:two-component system, NtrC family, sensor kinase
VSKPPSATESEQDSRGSLTKDRIQKQGLAVELADKALKDRPTFTIRMQVYLSVLFLFIIVLALAFITTTTTARVEAEVHLSQVTSKVLFEIEQARRFEKNYFLHGTNYEDALEHVQHAHQILHDNALGLEDMVGTSSLATMNRRIEAYGEVLEREAAPPLTDSNRRGAEGQVRQRGREMVSFAVKVEEQEKRKLNRLLSFSRNVQRFLIIFLLLYLGFITTMLIRRILDPIKRFMAYIQRIADGDHTPITPQRRFRDEFSAMAVAMNHMMAELDRRQDILVQTHKLRAIGTLTAGVAHELNNPINNITLTGHVLLEDYQELSDEARLEMVQDVIHEAGRTKKIVASLLDFARQSESKAEPFDLGEMIVKTVALAQNQLNLKGVRPELKITEHLPPVHGDTQQITQVLMNLLLNALDVTDKGGKIEIGLDQSVDRSFLELLVRDFGPGIPDHILPYIFDPFFTTKTKGKGTGLGLSISQGIVKKHGGDLRVETALGRGTTFIICLPVTSFPADFNQVRGQRERPGTIQSS